MGEQVGAEAGAQARGSPTGTQLGGSTGAEEEPHSPLGVVWSLKQENIPDDRSVIALDLDENNELRF